MLSTLHCSGGVIPSSVGPCFQGMARVFCFKGDRDCLLPFQEPTRTRVQSFILPSQLALFAVPSDGSVGRLSPHGLFMVRTAALPKGCYGYPHTRYSTELLMVVLTSHAQSPLALVS